MNTKIATKLEPTVRRMAKSEKPIVLDIRKAAEEVNGNFHRFLRPDAPINTNEIKPEIISFSSPYQNIEIKPEIPEVHKFDFMF